MEHIAIRQPRHIIEVRLFPDDVVKALDFRNIAEYAQIMRDIAVLVIDDVDVEPDREMLAVFMLVPYFAPPTAGRADRVPHCCR